MYYTESSGMSFLSSFQTKTKKTFQPPKVVRVADTHETTKQDVAVDVFQTDEAFVVFAQIAGVDINNIQITIEGEADIVIIEGRQTKPEYLVFPTGIPDGIYYAKECVWGEFYRRIILPEQIDIKNTEAKIKNGVLLLRLPLLNRQTATTHHRNLNNDVSAVA